MLFRSPARCPSCGTKLVREKGESAIRCMNAQCPAQFAEKLKHFVSKQGMDIDGLGVKTVEVLIEKGLLQSPADIYRLNEKKLSGLDRFGKKSVTRLLAAIEASKKRTLEKFINALGIPMTGPTTAEKLAKKAGSMKKLMSY